MPLESPEIQPPSYKLFSLRAIGVATYLGGPFGGALLLGINYNRLGKGNLRNQSILLGILSSLLLFWGLFSVPEEIMNQIPDFIVPAIYCWIMYPIASKLQGLHLKEHYARDGKKSSGWSIAGFSIVALIATVSTALLFMPMLDPYDFQGEIHEYGELNHLIYHSPEIETKTLDKFGALLTEWGYFDSEYQYTAEIRSTSIGPSVALAFQETYWRDTETQIYIASLKAAIESEVFDGPITLFLVDENLSDVYRQSFDSILAAPIPVTF